MGPLVVAMPRTTYRGAFGGGDSLAKGEASCSTLIGSETSEDPLLSGQMASRLSMKSGRAVLVSCQLQQPSPHGAPGTMSAMGGDDGDWGAGMDQDMIAYRAAALAEREIWRILQQL
jgi:Proteasome assembly chaperone 4